jgi:hypothetical protein
MIPQQDIPDHSQDLHNFQKDVEEAIEYHLANGGANAAREAVKDLAKVYFYKQEWPNVSREAMKKIKQYEDKQLIMEEQRKQQHIENAMRTMMGSITPPQQQIQNSIPVVLPQELSTERAMLIWKLLQDSHLVDENYQPKVSRTKAAIMAGWFFTQLNMDVQWPLFETLWHRENMRSDHSKGMDQKQMKNFQNKLKDIEASIPKPRTNAQLAAQLPRS